MSSKVGGGYYEDDDTVSGGLVTAGQSNVRNLDITHYSGQATDSVSEKKSDFSTLLDTGSDFIGLTEVNAKSRSTMNALIKADSDKTRYAFTAKGNLGILTRKGKSVTIIGTGHTKIHGNTGVEILWVKARWKDEIIFFHVTKWEKDKPGKTHGGSAKKVSALIRKHGSGNTLTYFSGDVNKSAPGEFPHLYFKSQGLHTIWAELGSFPDTAKYERTTDVIGSYVLDRRSRGVSFKVLTGYNTNSNVFTARYKVGDKNWVAANTPTPSDKGKSPQDPYTHAGNISWDDYNDDYVVPVETVIWDSDTHQH